MEHKYDIFISYRRNGGSDKAELLKNVFVNKGYPIERIFMDTHSLGSGDFKQRIKDAIVSSVNFVLVITKDCWKTQNIEDFFMFEIKSAINTGKNIVPVLFDSITDMNQVKFPDNISISLHHNNAVQYSHIYADAFYDKLCSFFIVQSDSYHNKYPIKDTNNDDFDFDYDDALDALASNNLSDAVTSLIQSIDSSGNMKSIELLSKVLWQNFGNIDWDNESWSFFERKSTEGVSYGDIALFFKYFKNKSTYDRAYSFLKKSLNDKNNGYVFMCDGYARMHGIGVPVNLQSAYRRFEYANKLQVPESYSFLAETFLNGDSNHIIDVQSGIDLLQIGSKLGDSRSELIQGQIYSSKKYGLYDIEKAKEHLYKATELQYHQAWLELGKIYGKLFRMDLEYDKAVYCYDQAISFGLLDGIACKAQLLWKRDCFEDAVKEVKKGVFLNIPSSISTMGRFYEQGIPDIDKWVIEHKPDIPKAWDCYQTAFDLSGNIDDAIAMARLYVNEEYRPQNCLWEKIESYLKEAIKIPKIEAINLMIDALKKNGRPEDAHIYLKIGADTGSLEFKYRYGIIMYTKDEGVAFKYMKEAAEQGYAQAIEKLLDWFKNDNSRSEMEYGYWMDKAYNSQIEVDIHDYSMYLKKLSREEDLKNFIKVIAHEGSIEKLFYAGYYMIGIASYYSQEELDYYIVRFIEHYYKLINFNPAFEGIIIDIILNLADSDRKSFYIGRLSKTTNYIPKVTEIINLIDNSESDEDSFRILQNALSNNNWNVSEINYLNKRVNSVFQEQIERDFVSRGNKINILLVDDVLTNLLMVKVLLQKTRADWNIHSISDSQSALRMIEDTIFDMQIILLDIMMPKIDGFEILKRLKSKDHKKIRIIVLSALHSEYEKSKAYNLGADDYITKPISQQLLIDAVKIHAKSLLLFNI